MFFIRVEFIHIIIEKYYGNVEIYVVNRSEFFKPPNTCLNWCY